MLVHCLSQQYIQFVCFDWACVCVLDIMNTWLFLVEVVTQKEEEWSFYGILALIKPCAKQKAACGNLPNEQRSFCADEGRIRSVSAEPVSRCFSWRESWLRS